jgi:two-component system, OmpR family, response regulator
MNVLFVDDHIAGADIFADIEEGLGHRACLAHDRVSALQRCSEETFDLIQLDISLPDGDGRDVCCELRRSAHAQKTRIVALTGHADLKGSSGMSDFDGCIVKPIAMQTLEALLKKPTRCHRYDRGVVSLFRATSVSTRRCVRNAGGYPITVSVPVRFRSGPSNKQHHRFA